MKTSSRSKQLIMAFRHKSMVRLLSGVMPYYVVNEYPKSGGTWLAQMTSDLLELPFRCQAPIRMEKSVTHGHFLSPLGLRNVVVLWRDPRDVIVSFYHHCYFINEHKNSLLVEMMKKHHPYRDYLDIRENLPDFIRHISISPLSPSFSWPEFAKQWACRAGTVHSSYEALRADTPRELARIAEALTGEPIDLKRAEAVAEKHSFAKAKARAQKDHKEETEISFIREGALGGWRRHFSPAAETELDKHGYTAYMSKLGYF